MLCYATLNHTIHYMIHTIYHIPYTIYHIQYTICNIQCTIYNILYDMYYYYTLPTMYDIPHNIYYNSGLTKPSPARFCPSPDQILEIWKPGNPGIWNAEKNKTWKFSKYKSMSPKMLARSRLARNITSRPHLGPSQAIFSLDPQK